MAKKSTAAIRFPPLQRIIAEPVRVLVVEEDSLLRVQIAEELRNNGFEPAEADGPASAIARLRERWYDVVILNVVAPKTGKADATSAAIVDEIARLERKPAVMIITDDADRLSEATTHRLGAVAYFGRNEELSQLHERIFKLWRQRPSRPDEFRTR